MTSPTTRAACSQTWLAPSSRPSHHRTFLSPVTPPRPRELRDAVFHGLHDESVDMPLARRTGLPSRLKL